MKILDEIIAHKRVEVAQRQAQRPLVELERAAALVPPAQSLATALRAPTSSGIIAEFKRRSPSKGVIHPAADVAAITRGYVAAGAAGLSVLTDEHFFGGSTADLITARNQVAVPILRKDFIIDAYQVWEARAMGADVVLLIAECLTAGEVRALAQTAQQLGMEVLLEVHHREQLDKWTPAIGLVGVNNRDLQTFTVSVATSLDLVGDMPTEVVKISESGLSDPQVLVQLREVGYRGFLMGEHFMVQPDPAAAAQSFIQALRRLEDYFNNALT